MSSSNCCFLTCIQISQEAGQVVWYFHLFQNFLQFIVIHTVKGFGIVNKAEIDVFLEVSWFFDDPADVGNLIPGSSIFSRYSLNIWKFMVHVLLKPGLENFEHYFTSMRDEYNCAVVWAFFGIAFLWDLNKNWPIPVLWPLLSLSLEKCKLNLQWDIIESLLEWLKQKLNKQRNKERRKGKWSRSVVSDCVTSWTIAYQAPLSMGFSRQ